jgi:hypothetical protein
MKRVNLSLVESWTFANTKVATIGVEHTESTTGPQL